jgi:glycosyltransferase involved in cell wall biosynthesis
MKAKILIDSISLLSPLTGIGRYTCEISKRIQDYNSFNISFYYGYYSKHLLNQKNNNIKDLKNLISKNKTIKKLFRKILLLSANIFNKKFDIYWEPNFIPLDSIKAKKIVTSVHDFSFILYKDFHPKERIEYFENNFFRNIYKSDVIICFSEFTKKEILEKLNFSEDCVKVIYHGIDHNLFKIYNNIELNFILPKKFILSVGSIEPRKNLIGLLKAYNRLPEYLKNEYHLVLAGFKGWNNKEIIDLINKNKKFIHYLGYISDIELAKVYNLASLFVYPSFYEGFGLPPLEAMACGTPVITSNVSSLPEVGGDAVVYCDPYDINDIKNKIEIVLNKKDLQKEMIRKGLKRAKQFTWEKSAREHLKVFKEVL